MTLDERALLLQVAVLVLNKNNISIGELNRLSDMIIRVSERQKNEGAAAREYIDEYLTDPALRQPAEQNVPAGLQKGLHD